MATMPSGPPITVLLAEFGDLTRSGLLALLGRDPRFTVVGEIFTDAAPASQELRREPVEVLADLTAKAHHVQPDLIVFDPVSRGASDHSVIDHLAAAVPNARLIILTSLFESDAFVATLLPRVHGYFLPGFAAHGDWLLDAFALIARSSVTVVDPEMTQRYWPSPGALAPFHRSQAENPSLTDRERAVVGGLAAGMTENQIATVEGVSLSTIRRTIAALQTKLEASSVFGLAFRAGRLGLIF